MVYFSKLQNSRLFDSKKVCLGQIKDLVFVDGKDYAEITHIVYQDKNKYKKKIPWSFVKELKEENSNKKSISVNLNSPHVSITPFFMNEKETFVGDILDKQVIDVNGVKLVRVNDIILGKVDEKFCVVAVCVGATSFIRRLGISKLTNFTTAKLKEQIIQWKSVERLEPVFHDLHLKIQKDKIEDLHPEDIADIMEDLSYDERILIFNLLNDRKAAKTLIKAGKNVQYTVLKSFKLKKILDLLENIPTDQAADILSLMPNTKRENILNDMRIESANKIRKILNYYPESIGAIMKTEFIAVPKNYSAQQTINLLRRLKIPSDRVYHIYIVDKESHLIGVLSIRALLIADPKSQVNDFMNKKVIFIRDKSPTENAARLMARYDLFVLPVVDKDNILRGIVKSDDVLDDFIPERLKNQKFLPSRFKSR